MNSRSNDLPGTPAPAGGDTDSGPGTIRAPKKPVDPAAPNALHLALLENITSSPSLITTTDIFSPSPPAGKDGNNTVKNYNGSKQLRDQVTCALEKDRKLYKAKTRLFQDYADVIDKTLQKAGTELYPYAVESSNFFAGCLNKWLGRGGRLPDSAACRTGGGPQKLAYAKATRASECNPPRMNQAEPTPKKLSDTTRPLAGKTRKDLRVFVRMDNSLLEPFGVKRSDNRSGLLALVDG
ncbi:hypothetical protein F5B22DRAFT_652771 [Xylaria bambusicola]|uniref:uncharacterized protein n=1 Tax=Xylaria bambusicola TaxID=326684 RepID=UPI002008DE35|nr:uncharacterized protein F5B22DRAFT_652771 [Xylaria bambusicola]KAI0502746.1 hypothetical protein F5B22DRAFT_652771 [Xylaria bambusicola]